MSDHPLPTEAEVRGWLRDRRNWGRWGDDDQVGAVNLITAQKRLEAIALVRSGRTHSLSRPYPKAPGPNNPQPAQHFLRTEPRAGGSGAALDYYGFMFHGRAMTHLDALCHVWDADGMWNGRDPKTELDPSGATWADITAWSGGIITRGVLLDVPRHRGSPYVTVEAPVHGWELEAIAEAQGVAVGAGDAVLVYSGFEAYRDAQPDDFGREPIPGLHASCIAYVRDHDVALLGWDMLDSKPADYGLAWGVHGVIYSYGVALLDNALLAPLAAACAAEGRHEFLLMVLPLRVEGGTGSPVNPVVMF